MIDDDQVSFWALLVAAVIIIPINGIVMVKLWEWFIVSLFSIREIRLPEALGLSLFSQYFLSRGSSGTVTPKKLVEAFLMPLLVLGVGWLIHQFV